MNFLEICVNISERISEIREAQPPDKLHCFYYTFITPKVVLLDYLYAETFLAAQEI